MGQKILLADDSITIQKVIELTFTDEDFELHTVGNGQKAIEEIRTVKPDIVLCDIIMPEKSGYEVCEHIKTSEDLKHIPVLLLTGAFEPFDQERAKKAGCDGFLAKPFEPQTLISKVKELLKSPRPSVTRQPVLATPPPPPPAEPSETTVMMSPGMKGLPSTPGAHLEGAAFQEDFAVEAGERELSVDSDDRTMFLGQQEETSGGESDDIWGEVERAPSIPPSRTASPHAEPEAPVDDGRTVMMSSPIVPGVPLPREPVGPIVSSETLHTFDPEERRDVREPEDLSPEGFTELPSSQDASEDSPWVIPGPDEDQGAESAEPELTPLGDFGGFDDFTADQPGLAQTARSALPVEPVEPTRPALPVEPMGAAARAWNAAPPRIATPVEESDLADEPFAELAPTVPSPTSKPVTPYAPPSAASSPGASQKGVGIAAAPKEATDLDALADQVAKKVLSQLSEKIIQEIAWEVVPDLAEALIQKEIEAIKAKIPK